MTSRARRLSALAALPVIAGLALSGCTVTLTISPDRLETLAADALEQQVGTRPTVDCGEDDVTLAENTEVDCLVGVEGDPVQYPAVVTLQNVDTDAMTYGVVVEVEDEPAAG